LKNCLYSLIKKYLKLLKEFPRTEWKGPLGANLASNNRCWIITYLPKGEFLFSVSARERKALGQYPYMFFRIDNRIVGGKWVETTEWKYYNFHSKLEKGKHKISLAFINDYYDPKAGKDRNLYVGELEIFKVIE
jgi:hypothetical protein